MKALVFDTETTGVDFTSMGLLEISWAIVHIESMNLIRVGGGIVSSNVTENPAFHINKIDVGVLDQGLPLQSILKLFVFDLKQVDVVMAHNIDFDCSVVNTMSARIGMEIDWPKIFCTSKDFQWPDQVTGKKLGHIATDLGIVVKGAHRALYDVLLLCECLQVCGSEYVSKVLNGCCVTLIAKVSFDEKDKAKEKGFQWNPPTKTWEKTVLVENPEESLVDNDTLVKQYSESYGFPVVLKPN